MHLLAGRFIFFLCDDLGFLKYKVKTLNFRIAPMSSNYIPIRFSYCHAGVTDVYFYLSEHYFNAVTEFFSTSFPKNTITSKAQKGDPTTATVGAVAIRYCAPRTHVYDDPALRTCCHVSVLDLNSEEER